MTVKKVPMRQCLALNESFPKHELFRIVRTPEGEVLVDLKGKVNGRGAYISKSKKAIETAKKFISMGLPFKQIAEGTGLSLEKIAELQKEIE